MLTAPVVRCEMHLFAVVHAYLMQLEATRLMLQHRPHVAAQTSCCSTDLMLQHRPWQQRPWVPNEVLSKTNEVRTHILVSILPLVCILAV